MSRASCTIHEGDRLWPLIEMIRKTHIDDLSEERIQQLVRTVDGWRITDADGARIHRPK